MTKDELTPSTANLQQSDSKLSNQEKNPIQDLSKGDTTIEAIGKERDSPKEEITKKEGDKSSEKIKEDQKESEEINSFLKKMNEKKNYNFDFGKINLNIDEDEQSSELPNENGVISSNKKRESIDEDPDLNILKSPSFLEIKGKNKPSRVFNEKLTNQEAELKSEDINLDKLSQLYGI